MILEIEELAKSVSAFHGRFDLWPDSSPDNLKRRLCLLVEEVGEYAQALNRGEEERALDELADILYVAMGTVLNCGDMAAEALRSVAVKNNSKTLETHEVRSGKVVRRDTVSSMQPTDTGT